MKAVLGWELTRRLFFTLWWTIDISTLIGVTVLSYLAFDQHAKQYDDVFSGITNSSAGSFFGGTDFFSPVGYLSSQIYYILLPILLILMVTTLAASLMNRDESDQTIELTLARPISRGKLLLAKALAGLIIVGIIGVLSYIVTVITVHIAGIKIDQWNLLIMHILSFGFGLSFGIISFALMAFSSFTRKFATIAAIILSFGGYILSSLSSFVKWLETPVAFTPYHYYDTAAILNGHVSSGLIIYLIGALIVGAVVATIGYTRRDIG